MVQKNLIYVVLCSLMLSGLVSAQLDGSTTANLSSVVDVSLDSVTSTPATEDESPSLSVKIGSSADAQAAVSTALEAEAESIQETEIEVDGVSQADVKVVGAVAIDADVLTRLVPADERARVLSRIREMRRDAITRHDERNVARLRMAQMLRSRAEIIRLSGIARAVARVDYSIERARERGDADVETRLSEWRAKLQARIDAGETTVPPGEEREIDRIIWYHHANRLAADARTSIELATKVEVAITRALNQMDTLEARLDASTEVDSRTRLNSLQARVGEAKAVLEEKIDASESALVTFKAESSVANARALHSAVIEMKVAATHASNAVRYWVSLFNHVERNRRDLAGVGVRMEQLVRTRAQIEADATAVAASEMNVALYGTASASTSADETPANGGGY